MIAFAMNYPKCDKNRWHLSYRGDTNPGECDETKNVKNLMGVNGTITITCKCGYTQEINLGND